MSKSRSVSMSRGGGEARDMTVRRSTPARRPSKARSS